MRSAHRRTKGPPVEKEWVLLFNCVDYIIIPNSRELVCPNFSEEGPGFLPLPPKMGDFFFQVCEKYRL